MQDSLCLVVIGKDTQRVKQLTALVTAVISLTCVEAAQLC